jgi:hypothetical protein
MNSIVFNSPSSPTPGFDLPRQRLPVPGQRHELVHDDAHMAFGVAFHNQAFVVSFANTPPRAALVQVGVVHEIHGRPVKHHGFAKLPYSKARATA